MVQTPKLKGRVFQIGLKYKTHIYMLLIKKNNFKNRDTNRRELKQ